MGQRRDGAIGAIQSPVELWEFCMIIYRYESDSYLTQTGCVNSLSCICWNYL